MEHKTLTVSEVQTLITLIQESIRRSGVAYDLADLATLVREMKIERMKQTIRARLSDLDAGELNMMELEITKTLTAKERVTKKSK